MPSPIRIGILGLGRGAGAFVPGLWAAQAHVPYLHSSPSFRIVAVANSSAASARAAIEHHKLGLEVAAYGSAEDLANDANVEMVVVSVRVGKHYALTKPALLAGKDVFVEWPLGVSGAEARELTEIAREKGVRTVVGVQARASPVVIKVKELIDSGKIGKVLSSTVVSTFGGLPTGMWPAGAEYYLDMDSGGNCFAIFFGHFLDSFIHVLGPFSTLQSTLKTEYKSFDIVDETYTKVVESGHPRTSPDHILVQGTLASGALASLTYYTAPAPSANSTGLRWIIAGTDGQIEITTLEGQWQVQTSGVTLKLRVGKEAEKVIEFDAKDEEEIQDIPKLGWNTARTYEAFLQGEKGKDKVADFEDALKTHELLDRIRQAAGW